MMDSDEISEIILNYNLSDCWNWTETHFDIGTKSRFWLEGVVQLFLAMIGLSTTSLSIFILSRKVLLRHTFNQLLIALAVFDSIFLLCMMVDSVKICLNLEIGNWFHALLTPYLLYPVKNMAMYGSIYMMMAVASERYIAVYHPFSRIPSHFQSSSGTARLRLGVYLSSVILLSVLLNLPLFFESKYTGVKPHYITILPLRLNHTYLTLRAWGRLLLICFIPMLVTSILNYKIFKVIPRSSRLCRGVDTPSIVLFFIVIIFLICSIPKLIISMYDATVDIKLLNTCMMNKRQSYPFWNFMLGLISNLLLVLNPFLNFVVYCFVGKTFRRLTIFHFGLRSSCWNKAPIPQVAYPRKNTLSTQC